MAENIDELAQTITQEVREWLDANVVGAVPLSETTRTVAELAVKRRLADELQVEPHEVELLNPRWEETTFVVDGARLK